MALGLACPLLNAPERVWRMIVLVVENDVTLAKAMSVMIESRGPDAGGGLRRGSASHPE